MKFTFLLVPNLTAMSSNGCRIVLDIKFDIHTQIKISLFFFKKREIYMPSDSLRSLADYCFLSFLFMQLAVLHCCSETEEIVTKMEKRTLWDISCADCTFLQSKLKKVGNLDSVE